MRLLRIAVFFLIGVFIGGFAVASYAATVPLTPPLTVSQVAGGYTANTFSSFMNQVMNGSPTAQVGTSSVSIPARYPVASTAGAVAAAALRAGSLVSTAGMLAWAAQAGLQWIDGQWKTQPVADPDITGFTYSCGPLTGLSGAVSAMAQTCATAGGWGTITITSTTTGHQGNITVNATSSRFGGGPYTVAILSRSASCAAGFYLDVGICKPMPLPTTQADWDRLMAQPLTDTALNDFAKAGIPVPLKSPEFLNPYEDVPYGFPKVDAITGQRVQPHARVTPQPDGRSADVQVFDKPVNPDGSPVVDPNTGEPVPNKPAEQPPFDLCKEHPEIIACQKFGEETMPESNDKNITVNITPDGGFGAADGSCPADLTHTMGLTGQVVRFSYQPVCTGLRIFRPVIIGMAWISAVLIFMGIARKAQG